MFSRRRFWQRVGLPDQRGGVFVQCAPGQGVEAAGVEAAATSAVDGREGSEAGVAAFTALMACVVGLGGCGLPFFWHPPSSASAVSAATSGPLIRIMPISSVARLEFANLALGFVLADAEGLLRFRAHLRAPAIAIVGSGARVLLLSMLLGMLSSPLDAFTAHGEKPSDCAGSVSCDERRTRVHTSHEASLVAAT